MREIRRISLPILRSQYHFLPLSRVGVDDDEVASCLLAGLDTLYDRGDVDNPKVVINFVLISIDDPFTRSVLRSRRFDRWLTIHVFGLRVVLKLCYSMSVSINPNSGSESAKTSCHLRFESSLGSNRQSVAAGLGPFQNTACWLPLPHIRAVLTSRLPLLTSSSLLCMAPFGHSHAITLLFLNINVNNGLPSPRDLDGQQLLGSNRKWGLLRFTDLLRDHGSLLDHPLWLLIGSHYETI